MFVYGHKVIFNTNCYFERCRNALNINYVGLATLNLRFSTPLEMIERVSFKLIITLRGYTILIIK